MATLLRKDMDIVILAATNVKMRAIRRPCQSHIGVGNAQCLPLNRLCLLNIENENIFIRLRRDLFSLGVIVAVVAAGENQQRAAIRANGR